MNATKQVARRETRAPAGARDAGMMRDRGGVERTAWTFAPLPRRMAAPLPVVMPERALAGGGCLSRKHSGGFTLVELLVVISMISILAAMGVVQYKNSVRRTQEATLKKNLFEMRDVIDQYYADKGKYPSTLDTLVSDGYLRRIPVDPITQSVDSWETVAADPDPGNPSTEPGISDVKSGAPGTSLDGSAYADW